jgi:hypothetical protein
MMAVDDEVGIAQLLDDDWCKGAVGECTGKPPLTLTQARLKRGELTVEIALSIGCPDDVGDIDRHDSEVAAPRRPQSFRCLGEREQTSIHMRRKRSRRVS